MYGRTILTCAHTNLVWVNSWQQVFIMPKYLPYLLLISVNGEVAFVEDMKDPPVKFYSINWIMFCKFATRVHVSHAYIWVVNMFHTKSLNSLYKIQRNLLRHLLFNVCILLSVLVSSVHILHPHSRMATT